MKRFLILSAITAFSRSSCEKETEVIIKHCNCPEDRGMTTSYYPDVWDIGWERPWTEDCEDQVFSEESHEFPWGEIITERHWVECN